MNFKVLLFLGYFFSIFSSYLNIAQVYADIDPKFIGLVCSGQPLPEFFKKEVLNAVGVPVTLDGLNLIYRDIYTNGKTTVILNDFSTRFGVASDGLSFTLEFKNSKDVTVGRADLELSNFEGAPRLKVELISFYDSNERTGGRLSSRLTQANVEFLRRISDNPLAQVTLEACTGEFFIVGHRVDAYGGYLWAQHGFAYADSMSESDLRAMYGDEWREHFDHREQAQNFKLWLRHRYGREKVEQKLSEDELKQINQVVDTWRFPWEMAIFDSKLVLGRSLGKFDGKLGKEFMADKKAVLREPNDKRFGRRGIRWRGSIYVNQKSSPGMQQYFKYILKE